MRQCIEKAENFIKKYSLSNLVLMGALVAVMGIVSPALLTAQEAFASSEQAAVSTMMAPEFRHHVRPAPISSITPDTSASATILADIQTKVELIQKQSSLVSEADLQKLSLVQLVLNQMEAGK